MLMKINKKYYVLIRDVIKIGNQFIDGETVYENKNTKFKTLCPNGHTQLVSTKSLYEGCRCKICVNLEQTTNIESINKDFIEYGKIISSIYKDVHTELICECKCGVVFKNTYKSLQRKVWCCPGCSKRKIYYEKPNYRWK